MMSRKDVKHVNWSSLGVLTLRVWKCVAQRESAVKQCCCDDIVIELATSLMM